MNKMPLTSILGLVTFVISSFQILTTCAKNENKKLEIKVLSEVSQLHTYFLNRVLMRTRMMII